MQNTLLDTLEKNEDEKEEIDMTMILRVNQGGRPMDWIPWQEAVLLYAKNMVLWAVGEETLRFHGGTSRLTGMRSYMDVHPVVAARGVVHSGDYRTSPPLTNRELFRRDRHTCMYCLVEPGGRHLTRDHVIPLSKGGRDCWLNVVTACRSCNQQKADHLLEDVGLHLHAVPYVPSYAEWLILHNRKIRVDQMEYLKAQCPKDSRLWS